LLPLPSFGGRKIYIVAKIQYLLVSDELLIKEDMMKTEKRIKMNKKIKSTILCALLIGIIFLAYMFTVSHKSESENIRLGYMTTWAEGSFPVQALRNAHIAENNRLNITYDKFQYGPPLVEAAITGQENILFTGWVPAVTLMSKSEDWMIVGKLAYFPMSLMARTGSNISKIEDLRGKKIGVGYGTGPYPVVMLSLKEHGLVPGKDVEIINMKPADMGAALQTSQVDAVAWAEPSITLFKEKNMAYPIENYNDIGFIVVSKKYAKEHPKEVKRFLVAFKESELYMSQNKEQIFNWFSEESQYNITLVRALITTEPNFNAKNISDINVAIDQSWIDATQKKINFEYETGLIASPLNLSEKIDMKYLP
jgi:sulfonate transport system substrate-binding protein